MLKSAPSWIRTPVEVVKESLTAFLDDDCPRSAAALSYYTAFSLPPLLILLLVGMGTFLDPEVIRGTIEAQVNNLMGSRGGAQVREFLYAARPPGGDGIIPTVLGVATLVFGATGFFVQLQRALNRAWRVAPDPKAGGIRRFVLKRLFSFTIILGVGFLLLVSLALTAVLEAIGEELSAALPADTSKVALHFVNLAISLPVIAALFAFIYRYIPDAVVAWRDVLSGAILTAILFLLGRTGIAMYLGRSNPGELYGAAGAFAVMLLWIYYTAMILLFGAEFTQITARRNGRAIVPEPGAVRMVYETERPQRGEPSASPIDGKET